MAPGTEPLSIESLLQKQKEEREAAARVSASSCRCSLAISSPSFQPKFLSREERAKIAIAKRAQEIHEEKRREEDNRKNREQLERDAETIRRQERDSKYTTSGSSRRLSSLYSHVPCHLVDRPCKQMMTTTIAAATVEIEVEELAVEIIGTGVQMMTGVQMTTGVQGTATSRPNHAQSVPKLLPFLPHHRREVPSPFRRPTRLPLDQMHPSPRR